MGYLTSTRTDREVFEQMKPLEYRLNPRLEVEDDLKTKGFFWGVGTCLVLEVLIWGFFHLPW